MAKPILDCYLNNPPTNVDRSVSVLDTGSSGPGSNPDLGNGVLIIAMHITRIRTMSFTGYGKLIQVNPVLKVYLR